MHEMMIAEKVVREARRAGATKFLRVEVGELSEITASELEEGLRNVLGVQIVDGIEGHSVTQMGVEELSFDSWEFKVDFVESVIECKCGYRGRAGIVDRGHGYCVWDCPSCHRAGKEVEVLEGGAIRVTEVE